MYHFFDVITSQWYPETWVTGGKQVRYTPNLGTIGEQQYKTGDPVVVENHVRALDYGLADLSIVSCKLKERLYHQN
jgi:hypothetical protein